MSGRVLVAGVGNVFLGDDGFGVEVARRLADEPLPANVEVVDFGIRGVHLAYELLEGYDTLVVVDAAPRGFDRGTVFVLEVDPADEIEASSLDAHDLSPESVLGMLKTLGGEVGRVWIVGCEPASIQEGIGLSPEVDRAVPDAVRAVRELIANRDAAAATDPAAVENEAANAARNRQGPERRMER